MSRDMRSHRVIGAVVAATAVVVGLPALPTVPGLAVPQARAAGTPDARDQVRRLEVEVDTLETELETAVEAANATQDRLREALAAERAAQRRYDAVRRADGAAGGQATRRVRELYRRGPVDLAMTTVAFSGTLDPADLVLGMRTAGAVLDADSLALETSQEALARTRSVVSALATTRRQRVSAQGDAHATRLAVQAGLESRRALLAGARADLVAALERDRRQAEELAVSWALGETIAGNGTAAASASATGGDLQATVDRLVADAPTPQAGIALAAARAMVGRPYEWGAEGPDTFDCSGLVQWAYGRAGVAVPRTAADQYTGLTHVPVEAMAPGDLVFFASGPDTASIHHVGIYLGGGLMLHAPRTGDVVRIAAVGRRPVFGASRPVGAAA